MAGGRKSKIVLLKSQDEYKTPSKTTTKTATKINNNNTVATDKLRDFRNGFSIKNTQTDPKRFKKIILTNKEGHVSMTTRLVTMTTNDSSSHLEPVSMTTRSTSDPVTVTKLITKQCLTNKKQPTSTTTGTTTTGTTTAATSSTATVNKRRYPKRKREKVKKYTDEEIVSDFDWDFESDFEEEEFLGKENYKQYTTTEESTIPLNIPKELTIKPSCIQSYDTTTTTSTGSTRKRRRLGVFTVQVIPKGMQFGPYKGMKLYYEDLKEGMNTNYMWEVRQFGELYFIDGQAENETNWMKYINCARNDEEQNLVAFQYQGDIYYETIKDIEPDNELCVWYSDQYAEELGMIDDEQDNDSQVLVCNNCGDSFISQSEFDIHLRTNRSCYKAFPQIFTCQRCRISFTRLHQLQDHLRKHEKEQSNVQPVAVRNNNNNSNNSDESMEDNGNTCPYCGKEYTTKYTLKSHISTHTGDKPYHCQYCGKAFATNAELRKHIRIHTGERPFVCDYCKKSFIQSVHLQIHLRSHTGEKPYKCRHCSKKFKRNDFLKAHLRTHADLEPYKCQYCDKTFTYASNLRQHLRIHTGRRGYQCKECGKEFVHHSLLKAHVRIHTGQKPYKCSFCDKRFTESGCLKRHILTHTGDKPFKCSYCSKEYSQNGTLRKHILVAHNNGKDVQPCELCGQVLNDNRYTKKHKCSAV